MRALLDPKQGNPSRNHSHPLSVGGLPSIPIDGAESTKAPEGVPPAAGQRRLTGPQHGPRLYTPPPPRRVTPSPQLRCGKGERAT